MNIIFSLSSILVLPFWALMIVAPHWRWTKRIMQSPFVIVAPALLYVILALPHIGEVIPVLLVRAIPDLVSKKSAPSVETQKSL